MNANLSVETLLFALGLTVLLAVISAFTFFTFAYLFVGGGVCILLILLSGFGGEAIALDIRQSFNKPKDRIMKYYDVIDNRLINASWRKNCTNLSKVVDELVRGFDGNSRWVLKEELDYCIQKRNGNGLIVYGDIICRSNHIRPLFDYFRYCLWVRGDFRFADVFSNKEAYLLYGEKMQGSEQGYAALSAWQGFLWIWCLNSIVLGQILKNNSCINLTGGDLFCYKYLRAC